MDLQTASGRLHALRARLREQAVDGFIVPHADEYQSEYTRPSGERLAWLTDFTGSAGTAVILPGCAAVFSDGRYMIQLAEQIDAACYEAVNGVKTGIGDWLKLRAENGQVIGYDPRLHTPKQIRDLQADIASAGLTLQPLSANPLDDLWQDRPADAVVMAELFPDTVAGRTSAEKRNDIAARLREKNIRAVILSLGDSIAWLLNIRGGDIPHNPVVLSYLILHDDGRADWFVDETKIGPDIRHHLGPSVAIRPERDIVLAVRELQGPVQIDCERVSQWVFELLDAAGLDVCDGVDPTIAPKALKTAEECAAMRAAHIRDGIALTKFLHWFDREAAKGHLTELDAVDRLLEFRQAQPHFRMTSFDTIAGWAAHGAIVHYRATPATNVRIEGNGLFLLDSGGQYSDGTTDITRTVCVGIPSAEMRDRFTRVMKGHIALALARFPEGTSGGQLDTLARRALWDVNLDYAHGTGHGVGCYLCVHEESARLSPRGTAPVRAGMILSNEPGYYKDGEYGIRCENLLLCYDTGVECSDGRRMLAFETMSLAPFDRRLIDDSLLSPEERAWLHAYHLRVYETLSPFLDAAERDWLHRHI